eukprot:scaffold1943_cov160-Amphora_coffeaeformis.AAC.6
MRALLTSLLLSGWAFAYTVDRRTIFQSLGAAAGVSALGPRPVDAVISSQYCASGVGEGCADLSEGNDLIRSLQEKSAANRERNEKAGCVKLKSFDHRGSWWKPESSNTRINLNNDSFTSFVYRKHAKPFI